MGHLIAVLRATAFDCQRWKNLYDSMYCILVLPANTGVGSLFIILFCFKQGNTTGDHNKYNTLRNIN